MATTAQLTATPFDASNTVLVNRVITFTSDTAAVATVNNQGLVSAVAVGTATITVACEGKTATVPVTVINANTVNSIVLSQTSSTVGVGSTVQLQATPEDSSGNPVSATVTWTSSDATKATVDATGLVTGVAQGAVTITAAVGAVTAPCAITVPSTATTRQVWLAADSLPLTDGDLVTTWTDQVAGIQATQSVNANKPVYEANAIGGLPGVNFVAASDLHFAGVDAAAFTRFFVCTPGVTTPTASMQLIKSPMVDFHVKTDGTIQFVIIKTGGLVVEWQSAAAACTLNAKQIIEVAYDATVLTNNPTVKVNGGSAIAMTLFGGAQTGTRVTDAGTTFLGSSTTGGALPLLGPLSEYVKIADVSDHTDERQRLATKYGITIT